MNTKVLIGFFIIMCFSLSGALAQQNVVSSGGDITGTGGSVSYSIGQIVYSTLNGSTGSVTEGLQQPYEISVLVGTNVPGINLEISAYPNPATDYLNLKVEDSKSNNLSYQLYDTNGKLLQVKKITGSQTQINMSSYLPAIYFIKVMSGNQKIKEFKIIKN